MAPTLILEDQLEVPMDIGSLSDFRRWALSGAFPPRGRIDYLCGRIEVDMSPEELFAHGVLKGEIYSILLEQVKKGRAGYLFTDSTRVSCPLAELSVEPDIVFVSRESLSSGRVTLTPKAGGAEHRYVELEGAVDMVAEIVSDISVGKDTQRLPSAYAKAGIGEFWLIDARGAELVFEIHSLVPGGYQRAAPDADGFQRSRVFSRSFVLERAVDEAGHWEFTLHGKA